MTFDAKPTVSVREFAYAMAAAILCALAFLARPIATASTHVWTPVDAATDSCTLTRVEGDGRAPSPILADPVVQFLPWALLCKREIEEGRAPLWNPHNGAGQPLLANYQSAPFSPFHWPFYVLGLSWALIVSAAAKLVCASLFTYLFLRELSVARGAAAFGAIVLAYSGFQLLWIQYPHVSVFALAPAALWFGERCLRTIEGPAPRAAWLGWTLSLFTAVAAGHPETLAFVAALACFYVLVRALLVANRASPRQIARRVGTLFAGAVLAVGLGAFQLLPFVEYLRDSAALRANRDAGRPLEFAQWPLLAFPDLAGTPVDESLFAYTLPSPNYQEFNAFHVGALALPLALIAMLALVRDRRATFFACVAALWIGCAWDFTGFSRWLAEETPLRHVLLVRTQPLWITPVAVLSALALDRWTSSAGRGGATRSAATLAVAAMLLLAMRSAAASYASEAAAVVELESEGVRSRIAAHVDAVSWAFASGAVAVSTLVIARSRWVRAAAWLALLGAAMYDCAASFRGYVPLRPRELVYPRTEAVEALLARVGSEPVLMLSRDALTPEANLPYGLNLVTSYDAMAIDGVARLSERYFGGNRATLFAERKGLDLFGVRYVLCRSDWLPIGTALGELMMPATRSSPYLTPEFYEDRPPVAHEPLESAQSARLEFTALEARMRALALWIHDDPRSHGTRGEVVLEEVGGARVAAREFSVGELRALVGGRRELVLEFAEQPDSRGRRYVLRILAADGPLALLKGQYARGYDDPRTRKSVVGDATPMEPTSALTLEGAPAKGGLAVDLAFGPSEFQRMGPIGQQVLFEYRQSRGQAWLVHRTSIAKDREEAWELVQSASFDPRTQAVLERDGEELQGTSGNDSDSVTLVERTPDRWLLRSHSADPGCLIVAQAHFPGWRARVDGEERPLLRANFALSAVEVPAGRHDVELLYRPASFRWGLVVSALSLAAGVVWIVVAPRRGARAPRAGRDAA